MSDLKWGSGLQDQSIFHPIVYISNISKFYLVSLLNKIPFVFNFIETTSFYVPSFSMCLFCFGNKILTAMLYNNILKENYGKSD